ncbi:flagellar hook-length control protein FliK [Phenylobacterium sp. 20VBR1]|uniref:Flagellar hook-length control protein FliK n=1 Tax=Phenylobacterium glaciei TaxID=2803784 RepID=A0A941HX62_9CAUL|nr:flagellar hook-length control protein FliK [Phenylobacterium glaciei]MBR7620746.1 flagellar hook-length control protein FliK [Phenylobacterium glaciei]
MTAPLNASTLQPAAATGAVTGLFGAASQGPMAGFEALLTAFFGNQGAGEPILGADGKPVSKTAAGAAKEAKTAKDGKAAPEATDTATPSTDAQILAALLAQPITAPIPVAATVVADDAATGGGAPAPSAFAPQLPAADAALAQAQAGPAAKTADTKTAKAAAAETETAKALDDAAATAPADDTAATAAAAAFDASKPAAARQAATAAAPASPEAPTPRTSAPPPAALAAAAAVAAPPPAPVTEAAEVAVAANTSLVAEAAEAAATPTDTAPATPTAAPKAKTTARAARNEAGVHTDAAATATVSSADPLTAKAVAHTETAATFDSGSEGKREEVAVAVEAKADVDTGQPAAPNVADAAAAASTAAPAEMRAGPQTVAHLAAQIVKKLEGRSTQFDVALNPEGLGRVDVRIEIGAQGRLTASMSFENPQAAAELRTRAGELQKALEQAGFDISGGIRFDVAADRGQGQAGQGQFGQDNSNNGGASRGRAFQAALDSADQTADAALSGALNLQRRTLVSGVDVRI